MHSLVPFVRRDLPGTRLESYRWDVVTATLSLPNAYAPSDSHRGGFPLQRTELLLIFAFWTVLAVLTAASRLLDPRGPALQRSAAPV